MVSSLDGKFKIFKELIYMDVIGPILVGIVLAIIHLVTLFVILGDIKRLIFCTNKVDATVKSVTEKVKKIKILKKSIHIELLLNMIIMVKRMSRFIPILIIADILKTPVLM